MRSPGQAAAEALDEARDERTRAGDRGARGDRDRRRDERRERERHELAERNKEAQRRIKQGEKSIDFFV